MKTNSLSAWILAVRPYSLGNSVILVLIGSALAWTDRGFHWLPAVLCLAFALLMQCTANLVNDLWDFLKGADQPDRLGPDRAFAKGYITLGAMKAGIAGFTLAACAAGVALLVWGAVRGRRAIVVNRVTIASDRLPEAFRGLRIVQFSDTHIGSMVNSRRELRALVDTINGLRPDLVVFSGDLVNIRYTELDQPAREILGAIRAPFGVVSTLGNHDVGIYVKDTVALPPEVNTARLIGLQREMGWNMLLDSTVYLHRGGDSISLSGVSFDRSMYRFRHTADVPIPGLEPVYAGVPAELFNVTVSHLPQLRHNIADLGYGDLILAGHVHSMQIKMRIGKRRFSPAQWFYDEWSGLYDNDGHRLYINDGIGYVGFPMRLGAYPEVTLFVLER